MHRSTVWLTAAGLWVALAHPVLAFSPGRPSLVQAPRLQQVSNRVERHHRVYYPRGSHPDLVSGGYNLTAPFPPPGTPPPARRRP